MKRKKYFAILLGIVGCSILLFGIYRNKKTGLTEIEAPSALQEVERIDFESSPSDDLIAKDESNSDQAREADVTSLSDENLQPVLKDFSEISRKMIFVNQIDGKIDPILKSKASYNFSRTRLNELSELANYVDQDETYRMQILDYLEGIVLSEIKTTFSEEALEDLKKRLTGRAKMA